MSKITKGPIKSDYYLGIKGYKNVKIDDKNQNILKGDHVKFDVSTGLAKVPVKDQAPAAKAVRQMGYYFDYHQWVEERNKQPGYKARPDPKKKKIKKLNLKGMKWNSLNIKLDKNKHKDLSLISRIVKISDIILNLFIVYKIILIIT